MPIPAQRYLIAEESFPGDKILQTRQNTTKRHIPTPFEKLDEIHQLMISLRLAWMPYSMIVLKVKEIYGKEYKEQSVRDMFSERGNCYEAYNYLKDQRTKERQRLIPEINEQLLQGAITGMGILQEGLQSDTVSERQIAIANAMLDRAGYPRVTKTDFSAKVEVNEMKRVGDMLQTILEKK